VAAAEQVGAKDFLFVLGDGDVQQPLAAGAARLEFDEGIFLGERFLDCLNRVETPSSVENDLTFSLGFFDDASLRCCLGKPTKDKRQQ